jgi:hypothetical protein
MTSNSSRLLVAHNHFYTCETSLHRLNNSTEPSNTRNQMKDKTGLGDKYAKLFDWLFTSPNIIFRSNKANFITD